MLEGLSADHITWLHELPRDGSLSHCIEGAEITRLINLGFVERDVFPSMDPALVYRLTDAGRAFLGTIERLRDAVNEILADVEKRCEWIDRDRREPDKVLCGTAAIAGEVGRFRAINHLSPIETATVTAKQVEAMTDLDGEERPAFVEVVAYFMLPTDAPLGEYKISATHVGGLDA